MKRDLPAALAAAELSAEEALAHCTARIDATDERINAFTLRTFERAQREARDIDARRARGESLPPLAPHDELAEIYQPAPFPPEDTE